MRIKIVINVLRFIDIICTFVTLCSAVLNRVIFINVWFFLNCRHSKVTILLRLFFYTYFIINHYLNKLFEKFKPF